MNLNTRVVGLLVLLIAMVYIFWILLSTPAYFRTTDAQWSDGIIKLPAGQTLFTIVDLTDLHYGENDARDAKSTAAIQGLLLHESETDLVVFGGDQISGYVIANPRDSLQKYTEPMHVVGALGIKFVSIFGNHDDQALQTGHMVQYHIAQALVFTTCAGVIVSTCRRDKNQLRILALVFVLALGLLLAFAPSNVMRHSLLHYEHANLKAFSMSRAGSPDLTSLSNYLIQVRHANQTALLFLLDSGGGRLEETYTDQQIKWVKSIAASEPGVGIAFGHIPPADFKTALTEPAKFLCIGSNHTEAIAPAAQESLSLMNELGKSGIKAFFSGHDHRNSYCCVPKSNTLSEPAMCYGRHSGYGGYGDWMRGARVIQLDFTFNMPEICTWLRMEDGTQREHIRLYPIRRLPNGEPP